MIFIKDIVLSDFIVCNDAQTFLQSSMWAEFKSRFGWTALSFLINWSDNTKQKTALLVLCRRLAPGFSFAYVPWGPQLPESFSDTERQKATAELALKLKPKLARNVVFIRFEPPWYTIDNEQWEEDKKQLSAFLSAGFKRSAATVQPPDTVIINLNNPCNEILFQMKSKWRYNIQLAQKKDIKVSTSDEQNIEIFYSLLKETAQRDGISIHNINYYKTLFEICKMKKIKLNLYIAKHEENTLAAIIVLFYGKYATYLYGASSNIKRNLMAPYMLQWAAMQDAKEEGCEYYDLFGIPPNEDPNHPMAGLYRFKTGFGGNIIHRPGSWDYPYKFLVYSIFNSAEKVRKKIMDRKKRRNLIKYPVKA